MKVRDFAVSDQAATRALVQAGLRERWGSEFDPTANPDTDDIWANYVIPGGEVVVAVLEGDIVGTGTLVAVTRDCGRLVRMSTHPAHRRKSIGRQIVADLIRRARTRGFDRLVVTTDTPWRSAVALYRSCGFEIEHQDDVATTLGMQLDGDSRAADGGGFG